MSQSIAIYPFRPESESRRSCKATALVVTVRISLASGASTETATATLKIAQPA